MDIHDIHNISTNCTRTEFVGTAVLDTIGLVISGVDDSLLKEMNVGTQYHCLGLFSSRTGAAGQITAIDDAVKATNTEVLSIELPRDTKGWGGHGNIFSRVVFPLPLRPMTAVKVPSSMTRFTSRSAYSFSLPF